MERCGERDLDAESYGRRTLPLPMQGSIRNFVRGALIAPMEGEYGAQEGTLDGQLACREPKAVFSKDGLFDELKKALAERVLNAELDDHSRQ